MKASHDLSMIGAWCRVRDWVWEDGMDVIIKHWSMQISVSTLIENARPRTFQLWVLLAIKIPSTPISFIPLSFEVLISNCGQICSGLQDNRNALGVKNERKMGFFEICINWPPDIPIKFINTGQEAWDGRVTPAWQSQDLAGKMIYSKGVIGHPWTIKMSAPSSEEVNMRNIIIANLLRRLLNSLAPINLRYRG